MCGKFTQRNEWRELVRLDEIAHTASVANVETITPIRYARVIALDRNGERKSVAMRWGLIPSHAADAREAKPHIHARAETIDSKPTFRDSFLHRRGLILVTTFNEGEEVGSKTVQYVCTPKDGKHIAIAVIWDRWSDGGPALLSFAMVTTPPCDIIATITDRMPALLEDSDWAKWLGEEPASVEELKAMLRVSSRDLDMVRAGKPAPPQKPPGSGCQGVLF
ncbi:MAG: SOS response-associated peptidase [Rhizomicrobium sp.]